MRPIRLLITLFSSIVALTILLLVIPSRSESAISSVTPQKKSKSNLQALFSFRTPLFPPSAIISLTDDNTTFFLARPAAFGPVLPGSGLSGQLWIGSGFGDDNLGRGGRTEGELGCSDVPGWEEGAGQPSRTGGGLAHDGKNPHTEEGEGNRRKKSRKSKSLKRGLEKVHADGGAEIETAVTKVEQDDGTDEHLFHTLPATEAAKTTNKGARKQHADIQSLQESAEIAGKVVLLSRGGCGFLEKVKWVQRRDGKALIVGDDVRGGPLVTMYARGDTSNISVPALFTSYTTAHLLSSLIPSGGAFGNLPTIGGKADRLAGKLNHGKEKNGDSESKPTFTPAVASPKSTSVAKPLLGAGRTDEQQDLKARKSWLRRLLSFIGFGNSNMDVSRRPPGSGKPGWVQVAEFEDSRPKLSSANVKTPNSDGPTADNFVIGVHDWRDPDLLPPQKKSDITVKPRKADKQLSEPNKLSGGIAKPGSGEYEKSGASSSDRNAKTGSKRPAEEGDGWLSHLTWKHRNDDNEETSSAGSKQCAGNKCKAKTQAQSKVDAESGGEGVLRHDGLWVTMTPTSMSSSPFFDTLLVLVVSPLVTLTVVYALLLLRSRIRRRRWRAPKSVVERLPVRTYHTISSEASTTSIATPNASSPTTPLLQPAPRPIPSRSSSRSRPRSRTSPEVVASSSLGDDRSPLQSPSTTEKHEGGLAEWRRKYGGRQKECVVCLEEYVDGVSRVMSLPCGHEFHVDCITPWLTTRRRTCPICKGDVVRSMQRTSPSRLNSNEERSSHRSISTAGDGDDEDDEEDEDEVQVRAATTRNDSPSAALPMTEEDLERGVQQRGPAPVPSWRAWAQNLWASLPVSRRREDVDRDR